MPSWMVSSVTALAFLPGVFLGSAAVPPRAAAEATTRTVFVTVTDSKGAAVTDLSAADFVVKEGGRAREITSAEPAKAGMRIAMLIDERLVADGPTRAGMFEFMKRLQAASEFSIITVGIRNTVVVDYTSDLNTHVAAINKFTLNPGPVSNLLEGIGDFSKILAKQRPPRPVIVVVAAPSGGEVGGVLVDEALNALRQAGAMLNAVALGSGGDGAGQVLDEGTRRSGGRRTNVAITTAIPNALNQIADDLSSQYQITYALPDGVKPDKRVSITVSRKGVTLRAPTVMPDK